MADFNLDRIRFTWKGDWTVSTSYVKDDIVRHQGKSYVCLIGHESNPNTIDPDLNHTNDLGVPNPKWELMFDGNQWKGDWEANTLYSLGDIIKWKGYVYQCVIAHESITNVILGPTANIANWTIVATTYNWRNEWTPTIPSVDGNPAIFSYYDLGDIVIYKGTTYSCTKKHQASTIDLGLEDDQDNWTVVTRSDNWNTDWTTSTFYSIDDVVKYGGIVYRCISPHTSVDDVTLGLEDNDESWEIVIDGVEYKGNWAPDGVRYKKNDIVKYGGSLWKATDQSVSTTSLRAESAVWEIWVPGLEYDRIWTADVEYNKGDIVVYGGYAYTALTNNTSSIPSVNGLVQDTGDWELLNQDYLFLGDWELSREYKTGAVVRLSGYLYVAIADSSGVYPGSDESIWQVINTGRQFRNTWIDNEIYYLGDVVTYAGTAYICIQQHTGTESDTRPDLDILNETDNYWILLLQGTSSNVMTSRGDLRTHDNIETARFGIGSSGNALKVASDIITWQNFEEVQNVFYVSVDGKDNTTSGKTLASPFRTVKYACDYIRDNVDVDSSNTTVFIKTGIYEEILPIKVPRNCALVGDELRSTVIMPSADYITSNMFYVNNGSGIRNMTLQGLSGELGDRNQYLTRRPTAGAFVSLDPGTGPNDESVWITNKSCYVQNVTTFGTGCTGMKIDGNLHNGGNKSVVANDFTQVLSDGIGYWALNGGRSELVSVFTYFCHIGYLSEDGGILRATNGNNSYGSYGSVAEGFSATEVPITANIDNQTKDAQVKEVLTNGNELVSFGYSNAGQSYTNVSETVVNGTGINGSFAYEQFRNNAIGNVRVLGSSDSSIPGGLNYQYLLNNAQQGTSTTITLAAADDTGTPEKYVGMRIVLVSGKGVGQYGVISGYNALTKVAIISKEYNGTAGWENLDKGRPIEDTLDGTTRYSLEPRLTTETVPFTNSTPTINWPAGFFNSTQDIKAINYLNGTYIAINGAGDAAISTDGSNFTLSQSNLSGTGSWTSTLSSVSATSMYFLDSSASKIHRYNLQADSWTNFVLDSAQSDYNSMYTNDNDVSVIIYNTGYNTFDTNGQSQTTNAFTNNGGLFWKSVTYGNGQWVAIKGDGTTATSSNGANWTEFPNVISNNNQWNSVAYGNGRYVAVGENLSVGLAQASYSFDGEIWYASDSHEETLPESALNSIQFSNGEFVAITLSGSGNDYIIKSKDGWAWQWFNEDSTSYSISNTSAIESFVNDGNNIILSETGANGTLIHLTSITTAFVRAVVESSRITEVTIYDSGAGYQSEPAIIATDPENTADALFEVTVANGVLPPPLITNRGIGYVTATATVSGDGFAEIYQLGRTLFLKNVLRVPGPGANVVINGIDDVTYRLTKVVSESLTAPYDIEINISPTLKAFETPDHNESVIIREEYSQVRLTGHDFLDIGVGNTTSARYPQLYLEGENPETPRQPFNETVNNGGGRVFYTSTDQDGNFRVGELFQVDQATGSVTVNADLFELDGLSELALGGIQVGGSAVVVREFSKDATFVANSNNIVPTERAIISYLESRISSGGSDALTNTLIAGQVKVSGNNITTTSGNQINIPVTINQTGGIDGDMIAHQLFGI